MEELKLTGFVPFKRWADRYPCWASGRTWRVPSLFCSREWHPWTRACRRRGSAGRESNGWTELQPPVRQSPFWKKKIVGCSFEHATSWRSRPSSKSKKTKEPWCREKAQLFQGTVSQWQLFCYTGFVIKLSIKIRSGNRVVLHLFWLFIVKSFSLPKLWKSEVFELMCPMPSID